LRHAASFLFRQPEQKKLILLVTTASQRYRCARPAVSTPRHKKAVEELAARGVKTFCLTLDPNADDYVARIFGQKNFMWSITSIACRTAADAVRRSDALDPYARHRRSDRRFPPLPVRVLREQRELVERLVAGQTPKMMVVACSDSRVDPAIVTDCDRRLFVVRNVANLCAVRGRRRLPRHLGCARICGALPARRACDRDGPCALRRHPRAAGRYPFRRRAGKFITPWMSIAEEAATKRPLVTPTVMPSHARSPASRRRCEFRSEIC